MVQALGALGPYARKPFEPSFVKERTQFVAKQPGHVKVTMRLLKWWRDQQAWSCALTRPSDFALELIAIYASQQCGKVTQAQMVANCMSLLSRFDQLRVVAAHAAEAAADGPREPVQQRGGPAGLRRSRADGVREEHALLLVSLQARQPSAAAA